MYKFSFNPQEGGKGLNIRNFGAPAFSQQETEARACQLTKIYDA